MTSFTQELQKPQYADLIAAKDWYGISVLLNEKNKAYREERYITRNRFIMGTAPGVFRLGLKDEETIKRWKLILDWILQADLADMAAPQVTSLFGAAIADGLLTEEEVFAINHEPSSIGESYFGMGFEVVPFFVRDYLGES